MLRIARLTALAREQSAAKWIPFSVHVAPQVLRTTAGDYLQVLRMGGASFESVSDAELNSWHERLNVLWKNIASPQVAIWTHVIRRRERIESGDSQVQGFAASLERRYAQRLATETLMVNELFLAVLYRPPSGATTGLLARALPRSHTDGRALELIDSLQACAKLSQTLYAALAPYEPEILGSYRRGESWFSSLLEYLGLIVNGEWRRVPIPRCPAAAALATSRLLFGSEAIEYRSATRVRIGAMLGIKEYPTPTPVGMFDRLLSAPFPFVLTQSFAFLSRQAAQGLLQRQYHRMRNAGDFAVSQADELKRALDALTSNEFVFGEHHFSLQVLSEPTEADAAARRLGRLDEHIALASSLLADTGMTVAREDLALEAAFWAQLPGNFSLRPRQAPISSRNFAAMAGFHNYPPGHADGNHWGRSLSVLITRARSAYHFSLHARECTDSDSGRKDTGHTFICGPTGSGKTVFIGFLIAMVERRNVTQIVFDKDRGLEILVRALGGEYLPLSNGLSTGFNPLQLDSTPANTEFLKSWLRALASHAGAVPTVAQEADLEQALRGTLALEPAQRRLSRLIEFLDPTDPEGLHARLAPWCDSCRGDYAWVFDNAVDCVAGRIAAHATIGFDVTEFIENARVRTPVTLYLFHLVRRLLDGRRLVCWMDEFWRLLADPAFEAFAKDAPKTWRKLNGVLSLSTQSASDVLGSPISRTIVEQTPTKVFFPNANAELEECRALGLTQREWELLRQLEPGSRQFLIKQGLQSVVCRLDLAGLEAEVAILSGRAGRVRRMESLIDRLGSEPGSWLGPLMDCVGSEEDQSEPGAHGKRSRAKVRYEAGSGVGPVE